VVSVRIQRDYDLPGLDWPHLETIVDVGAHVGAFTIWAGMKSPNASIVAIEPNPATFALLERNVAANGLSGRTQLINGAVGEVRGRAHLNVEKFSVASRMANVPGSGLLVDVWTLEDVLDQWVKRRIDLLKMDCEGCEYSSLLGSSDSLIRQARVIVCEYHSVDGQNPAEIASRLTALGFRVQMDTSAQGLIHAWQPRPVIKNQQHRPRIELN
jgi:FkbM family methyltransferase